MRYSYIKQKFNYKLQKVFKKNKKVKNDKANINIKGERKY